jgi:PKD repeat protein
VHVNPLPIADFKTDGPFCTNNAVAFIDQSNIATGKIVRYNWSLGNATILNRNVPDSFQYLYPQAGDYKVALMLESDSACNSTVVEKTITISNKPIVLFDLPENCINDPFSLFTNKSSVVDLLNPSLTYNWFFGDALSLPVDNTSTLQDPKHKYVASGNYNVKLLATSGAFC